jgi:hypothetical protein
MKRKISEKGEVDEEELGGEARASGIIKISKWNYYEYNMYSIHPHKFFHFLVVFITQLFKSPPTLNYSTLSIKE